MTSGPGIPGNFDPRFLEAVLPALTTAIIGWFVLMAVTGWLAARRNWDDGFWALLALLTGPIALAIVLLAPRRMTPPTRYVGATFREAEAAPGWPVFPAREARMTASQRIVSTAIAGLLGAIGAAAQVTAEVRPFAPILVVAGAVSAALVARWLAPSLVGSTRLRKLWVALAAATLALSIAAVLTVAVVGVAGVLNGTTGLEALPFYVAAAAFSPVVSAVFEPAPFIVAVAIAGAWVSATWMIVERNPASSSLRTHLASR